MNSTTFERAAGRRLADPIAFALQRTMTQLVRGLNAMDRKARESRSGTAKEAAALLRLAESYESTQPSYAADLRAAAILAGERTSRA